MKKKYIYDEIRIFFLSEKEYDKAILQCENYADNTEHPINLEPFKGNVEYWKSFWEQF